MVQERVMRARERASPKHDGADGTLSGGILNANIAATRFLLDRHFRNDGNAHSRSHHAEKAAELAALKNNLRMKAGAIAGGYGVIAEAMAVAEQEERLGAKLF